MFILPVAQVGVTVTVTTSVARCRSWKLEVLLGSLGAQGEHHVELCLLRPRFLVCLFELDF